MELTAERFKGLLLQIVGECDLDTLLRVIVSELADESDVALARIWLIRPGDICASCPRRDDCPQHTACLHLVASGGTPLNATTPAGETLDWTRTNGNFRRFPLGVRKIGRVGTGETVRIETIEGNEAWLADPEWATREQIRGFGGVPLTYSGEVLGCLGVFTRSDFCEDTLEWMRIVADHAAAAIANARAFQEIESLRGELALENEYLREEVSEAKSLGAIVGTSASLASVLQRIALVAPTDATVLIQGESGTGKELVAREIHRLSERAERPLIQVNCAAISRELYESEFFGHARGAFTGATRERAGRFAAAHGGTLFLDEVGEIPLDLQGKLLRVLQEGSYERVGEEQTREVDVRIVAATNRDLRAEVAAGRFREDLYYRLDVFPIEVAPLRERREDISALADHFIARTARRLGRRVPRLDGKSYAALRGYDWPGNVRELQNVLERAIITWRGGPLRVDLKLSSATRTSSQKVSSSTSDADRVGESPILTDLELRDRERENIEAALRRTRWKIAGPGGAAELIGVRPSTLASRIKKLGVERPI